MLRWDNLSESQQRLVEAAEKARDKSYSPYSGFKVGVALRAQTGEIILGTNFENASYGLTVCAERVAIFAANVQGIRKLESVAIIAEGKEGPVENIVVPCGACRQVLYEAAQLSGKDLELILSNSNKTRLQLTTIGDLLPSAFGPQDLGVDLS